jgi:molybdopterin converting factor small subunit
VKLRFYGRLAEAIAPELEINAPQGCSVSELRDRVAAEHPQAGDVLRSRRARTCVGDRLVNEDYSLAAGETLEFLPPVSGG